VLLDGLAGLTAGLLGGALVDLRLNGDLAGVLLHTFTRLLAGLVRRPLINPRRDRDLDDLALDLLLDRIRNTLEGGNDLQRCVTDGRQLAHLLGC
jgi:hypothetical protein